MSGRRCSKCGSPGPFYREYEPCVACVKAAAKDWRAANPERARKADRRSRLKRFGLTLEAYDALLEAQRGRCFICATEPHPSRCLAVDHDYDTGEVRGLLCDRCNLAIGTLGDCAETIDRALGYLRQPPARAVFADLPAYQRPAMAGPQLELATSLSVKSDQETE